MAEVWIHSTAIDKLIVFGSMVESIGKYGMAYHCLFLLTVNILQE
jgi:hypothetical protein